MVRNINYSINHDSLQHNACACSEETLANRGLYKKINTEQKNGLHTLDCYFALVKR